MRFRRLFAVLSVLSLFAALAPAAHAVDGAWTRIGPAPRCWGSSAAYDAVRHRLLVFGGSPFDGTGISNSFNVVWALSLSGGSGWKALTEQGVGPQGRESSSMIYDPVRDRVVVFGGTNGAPFNDVWALSLSGPATWTQLLPTGLPPAARTGHTAIYDPVGDRMIVFGGNDAANVDHNDVWAMSLGASPAWTPLAPTGTLPPVRGWHSAIYDPTRARMVIFAGYVWSTFGSRSDAWALDLTGTPAWSAISAGGTPPLARNSHTAIYDPAGDRMLVYGGYHDPGQPAQITSLSFAGSPAWSVFTPTNGPAAARDGASGAYDPVGQRFLVYSGMDDEFGQVWAATLSGSPSWATLAPVGAPLSQYYRVVRDTQRDRLVAIATNGDTMRVYAQSLATGAWSRVYTTGVNPPSFGGFAAVYDPAGDRMLLCGGGGYEDVVPLWSLDFDAGNVWSAVPVNGTPAPGRMHPSVILDPVRYRLIMHGGQGGPFNELLEEAWAFSLGGGNWTQLSPTGIPPVGRTNHTAIYDPDGDRMVICGGYFGNFTYGNDVWALSLASPVWTQIVPQTPLPGTIHAASAVYDGVHHRMLMFGGSYNGGLSNRLWSLPMTGPPVWTQLNPAGFAPFPRTFPGTVFDSSRDRLVVFGGQVIFTNSGFINDTWTWNPINTDAVEPGAGAPRVSNLSLAPPSPNPSVGTTALDFTLASGGRGTLEVFDPRGRRLRTLLRGVLEAGTHRILWDGTDDRGRAVPSGLYFVRLECAGETVGRSVVRVR